MNDTLLQVLQLEFLNSENYFETFKEGMEKFTSASLEEKRVMIGNLCYYYSGFCDESYNEHPVKCLKSFDFSGTVCAVALLCLHNIAIGKELPSNAFIMPQIEIMGEEQFEDVFDKLIMSELANDNHFLDMTIIMLYSHLYTQSKLSICKDEEKIQKAIASTKWFICEQMIHYKNHNANINVCFSLTQSIYNLTSDKSQLSKILKEEWKKIPQSFQDIANKHDIECFKTEEETDLFKILSISLLLGNNGYFDSLGIENPILSIPKKIDIKVT